MNSVTKSGKSSLELYLSRKPMSMGNINYITKVEFSKTPIDIFLLTNADFTHTGDVYYRIYSTPLGLVPFYLKENQTFYHGIVKKLNKLQKNEDEQPTHLVITKRTNSGDEDVTVHTVYRLTQEQETTILHDGIMPAVDKREKALDDAYFKSQEQFQKKNGGIKK